MKNKRNSNIEMLRIICMICIIIHHSFVHSGITVYYDNILIEIIKALGPISNNIFILITGYYMVNYKTKKFNIIKLVLETIFYSYSILIINVLILKKVNSYMIIKSIFPILTNSEWFITGYLLLYLSITIINRLLENINEKEHKKIIIFGIIVFSILPTIELLNSYFSIYIWFIFLYIVGAFIGKYKEKYNELIKKGWIVFLLSIINLVFIINQNKEDLIVGLGMNNIANFGVSLSVFMIFINKKQFCNDSINYIAASVLGVYLIHDNFILRDIIWNKVKLLELYNTSNFWIYEICIVCLIFIVCILIDKLRIFIIEKPIMNKIEKIILNRKLKANVNDKREKNVKIVSIEIK